MCLSPVGRLSQTSRGCTTLSSRQWRRPCITTVSRSRAAIPSSRLINVYLRQSSEQSVLRFRQRAQTWEMERMSPKDDGSYWTKKVNTKMRISSSRKQIGGIGAISRWGIKRGEEIQEVRPRCLIGGICTCYFEKPRASEPGWRSNLSHALLHPFPSQ